MKSGDFNLISNITHRPFFHEKVFESWREIKIASNHFEFYLGSNLIPRVSQRVMSRLTFALLFKIMRSRIIFEFYYCIEKSITNKPSRTDR